MLRTCIDLYLVSGFLGSGKTTFLKDCLNNLEGKRVGVLVNEFGRIGIDGRLIEKDGIQLVEINNGSIFCSCLKGNFIEALLNFSVSDIDLLFIENSGMADPSNIHQILEELKSRVDRQYQYKGSVCIIDSVYFLKQIQVLAPVQNQVASGNLIVINKIDMVNQSVIEKIKEKIAEINPKAFIYETMFSKVPITVLNEKLVDSGYLGETSNHPWNRPATYSIECDGIFEKKIIIAFAEQMKKYVYRMKGFLKSENGWWQVDTVSDDIKVYEAASDEKVSVTLSRLVIIGKNTTDFEYIILKAWKDLFEVKPRISCDFDLCKKKELKISLTHNRIIKIKQPGNSKCNCVKSEDKQEDSNNF